MWACSASRSGCGANRLRLPNERGCSRIGPSPRQRDITSGRVRSGPMATTAEVRDLLATTSLPGALVDELLEQASAAWLVGEPAEALAADLALCHPPLADAEVRAVVHPTAAPGTWRVCIVAEDRPGLLARAAGVLAAGGLTVLSASGSL